jgi:hypothetical protein
VKRASLTRVATQGRGRGRGRGGSQGGPASGGRGGHGARGEDKPRREAILDLAKYTDKKICVKFTGGRQGKFSVRRESCCESSLTITTNRSHGHLEGIRSASQLGDGRYRGDSER